MQWSDYNYALYPLVQSFGSYSKEEITEGFRMRKNQQLQAFKQEINRSIAEMHRLDLTAYQEPSRINYETPWKDELEQRQISDDYLDQMLKENNCDSLLELTLKMKTNREAIPLD